MVSMQVWTVQPLESVDVCTYCVGLQSGVTTGGQGVEHEGYQQPLAPADQTMLPLSQIGSWLAGHPGPLSYGVTGKQVWAGHPLESINAS
jgi:hypothetical protein